MAFCSNCGAPLQGAMKFCSKCGYHIGLDELEQIKKSGTPQKTREHYHVTQFEDDDNNNDMDESSDEDYNDMESAEVITKPDYPDRPIPPGTKVKEKIPKSTNCSVCGTKTDDICFFCDWGICKKHSVNLQIKTDTGRFGNIIQSCPDCADHKNGRQPTEEEAAEVGFFFKIKPYHEWKLIP